MKRKFTKKFGLAFVATFVLAFMLCIFGPSEIFFANVSQFGFVYGEFIGILIFISVSMSLVAALILSVLPQKLYNILVSIEVGISIAGYLQVMFLNSGLDLLGVTPDGYQVDVRRQIINIAIWGMIALVVAVLSFIKNNLWKTVVTYVPVFLLCIQMVALVTLCATAKEEAYTYSEDEWYLSGEKQYVVSADKNVIVIVLDYFSNQYVPRMLEYYPDALDPLHDFTYYNNMDSTYYGTFPSLAHMLTGQMVKNDMKINDWFVEIWDNDKTKRFYKEAHEKNYVTNVYTPDTKFLYGSNDGSMLDGVVSNIVNTSREKEINHKLLVKTMLKMSGYRMFPEMVKPYFYTDMDEYTDIVSVKENKINHKNYEFYEGLLEKGLSVDEKSNYYIVQHLMGPHVLDTGEDGLYKENSWVGETAKGCLVIVEEYLNQLKKLEVYDNATIIITTDHGAENDPQGIYFIKQPGESHDEMIVTNAPISHREFLPTIADALGMDSSLFGETIYNFKQDELRERTVWYRSYTSMYPKVPSFTSDKDGAANAYFGYTYTGTLEDLFETFSDGPDIIEPIVESYY